MSVSSRHQGDLGGRFVPFRDAGKLPISIVIETPETIATQHLAWMLLNLLVRLDGYVEKVSISCPRGVQLSPLVIPWRKETSDFLETLLGEGNRLGLIPVTADEQCPYVLVLGPGRSVARNRWRAHGEGWWGGISRMGIESSGASPLPFGPYIAACLAVSELFKFCRLKPELKEHFDTCFFSCWSIEAADHRPPDGRELMAPLRLAFDLAGVGAVGNAFLHTLSAVPGIGVESELWDNDGKGLDETNLNRYVLFGRPHLGRKKAEAAIEVLRDLNWALQPHNLPFSECHAPRSRVISAVDGNTARESIQLKYPARIISGSTHDLRAEVLRCGPPGKGACLRCFNPPEMAETDDILLDQLKQMSPEEFAQKCVTAGVSLEKARAWVKEPKCGQEGERLLAFMRTQQDRPAAFAVGFVSVLAGVLMATELVKDAIGAGVPLNNTHNRLSFQFLNPLCGINSAGRLAPDPRCPSCAPAEIKTKIWKRRFDALEPRRT